MFEGRKLLISSKHKKEQAIAPLIFNSLKIKCFTEPLLDTDQFGTFTGDIERRHDPFTTAKLKCELGLSMAKHDLGLANEGSFGPHPSLLFVPADDEIIVLIDKKNDLMITARELSADTNFGGKDIHSEEEMLEFADKHLFPSHAMILSSVQKNQAPILKGITSKEELIEGFNQLYSRSVPVKIETDMRAIYNPSRMKVIERTCEKLIDKIKSSCPRCKTPGFSLTDIVPGLPCKLCGTSTRSAFKHVHRCQKCNYEIIHTHPNRKEYEDPMYCDTCNP